MERLKTQAVGWLVIALVGGVGYLFVKNPSLIVAAMWVYVLGTVANVVGETIRDNLKR